MKVRLKKATVKDAPCILEMQIEAFVPLLNKYKDDETNPANESLERVIERIIQPNRDYYKILADDGVVGAICVVERGQSQFWISPMFILPSFQGKGIAQEVLIIVEEMYPRATSWELSTIMEEERLCYLYEKMGYLKTGVIEKLNDRATLIFYKKIMIS